ncbi:MAG: bifunctional DNA primase/polymerase [Chlorobia bacterium]|nr:bifunctional DNA primase/polymerase [Fimbriimonadaceae bacterium]
MNLGWSLVPIPHRGKFPTIPWLCYQQQPADAETVERWVSDGNGLGVVCGEVSNGLVCLDFDDQIAYLSWAAKSPIAKTLPTAKSQRGYHVFYRSKGYQPSGKLHSNGHAVGDVLSNGKLVVLPPTTHPSGFIREWEREPFDNLPFHDLRELGLESQAIDQIEPVDGKVEQGSRHCYLVKEALKLAKAVSMTDAMPRLAKVNDEVCLPPIDRQELGNILAWAYGKEVPESRSHSHKNIWE